MACATQMLRIKSSIEFSTCQPFNTNKLILNSILNSCPIKDMISIKSTYSVGMLSYKYLQGKCFINHLFLSQSSLPYPNSKPHVDNLIAQKSIIYEGACCSFSLHNFTYIYICIYMQ